MCKKRVCEPVSLIRVDFNPFNSLLGEGGVAGTLGVLWIALKIGVYFLIMKIRYNPLQEVDLSQNRSSSHPNI